MKIVPFLAIFWEISYVALSERIIHSPANFLMDHFDDFNVILLTQPRLTRVPLALATQTIEEAWKLVIPMEIRDNLYRLNRQRFKFRTSIFVFLVFPSEKGRGFDNLVFVRPYNRFSFEIPAKYYADLFIYVITSSKSTEHRHVNPQERQKKQCYIPFVFISLSFVIPEISAAGQGAVTTVARLESVSAIRMLCNGPAYAAACMVKLDGNEVTAITEQFSYELVMQLLATRWRERYRAEVLMRYVDVEVRTHWAHTKSLVESAPVRLLRLHKDSLRCC